MGSGSKARALNWAQITRKCCSAGTGLGPNDISQKPDEARAQLAPKPVGLFTERAIILPISSAIMPGLTGSKPI